MRKRHSFKRDVLADPIYNTKTVTKLIFGDSANKMKESIEKWYSFESIKLGAILQ